MTQPAKVQEPSMEEILASIRRIIADDEAKPPAAEKAAAPEPPKAEKPAAPAPKPVMNDVPPSKIAAAAPAKAAPPPAPAPTPAPASNSQDDIDALLAGLDETTAPAAEAPPAEPEPDPEPEVLELTDDMAVAPPTPAPAPAAASFRKVEPQDDIEFIESGRLARKAPQPAAAPAFESAFEPMPPKQPILAPSTVNAVESAFNALANTVLSNNARTLEDLVKEMLRPMRC
ncbi:cell pole-organizing protein PopZ [Bradyrhizobium sp. USDA 4369]